MATDRTPQTHDYTRRTWGHDYVFQPREGGLYAHMMGWGDGIAPGDYLILPVGHAGRTTRYRVTTVTYYADPPDMWDAQVRFAPRERPPTTQGGLS